MHRDETRITGSALMNLDRLINRSLDGRAEPEELAELAERLTHDDDAAMRLAQHTLLLQHIEDHYRLQAIKADLMQGSLESPIADVLQDSQPGQHLIPACDSQLPDQPLTSQQSNSFVRRAAGGAKSIARGTLDWRRHPLQFFMLAVSITLILWAGFSAFLLPDLTHPARPNLATQQRQPDTPVTVTGPDFAIGAIARLVSHEGANWEGFVPNGRGIPAGQQLSLRSGLAEIKYTSGAVVILEGPAEFTVGPRPLGTAKLGTSPLNNSGYLALGTLVARAEGNRAKGFTVEMPHARIVDLGTEFGAQVQQSGSSDVIVLSGTVDLISQPTGGRSGQRIRLEEDQAASTDATGGAIERRNNLDPELVSEMRNRLQTGSIAAKTLSGITLDDTSAKLTGAWSDSTNFKPHLGAGYLYSGQSGKQTQGDGSATATFRTKVPQSGQYRLLMAYSPHETRAKNVPVTVNSGSYNAEFKVDQSQPMPAGQHFRLVGTVQLDSNLQTVITISNTDTVGFVIVDAVQLIPAD